MIEIEMVANVDPWVKGSRYLVSDSHWLARSGYAKVVRHVEDPPSGGVGTTRTASDRRRLARRSTKGVTGGQGGVEPGSGPDRGAAGGQASGLSGRRAGTSGDETGGSTVSGAS